MAQRTIEEKWIACARKKPYPSRKDAADAAVIVKKKIGKEMGHYRCEHCGRFHLFTLDKQR